MSRTFKDAKEMRSKRRQKEPNFSRCYRRVLEQGFTEDLEASICRCGTVVPVGSGSCEKCSAALEEVEIHELVFSNVA